MTFKEDITGIILAGGKGTRMGGPYAGLQASSTRHNLVLSCNMPFVEPAQLEVPEKRLIL